jgi:heme/copper-type cytochrome/quinol oxidase subunit 2
VRITFQDGEVSGPRRPEFSVGDRVVLIVRSDVADHVHVHGYDLMQDVAPGAPARISFRADAPGRFEVELEDRHLPLTELVVRP